jgi:hypothetical protein
VALLALLLACGPEVGEHVSGSDPCREGIDCTATCGAGGSHSHFARPDTCACDPGYDWCNPLDDRDYGCCRADDVCPGDTYFASGACYCPDPLTWCHPDDPTDYSCCEVGDPGSSGETGSGGADPTSAGTSGDGTPGGTPPPDICPPDQEGYYYCTHSEAMGPDGSRFYICQDGRWTEDGATPDRICREDGYSAAAGCVDDGTQVVFICDP